MNEEFDLTKVELQNAVDINEIYNNPVVKTVFGALNLFSGLGQGLDAAVAMQISQFQKNKQDKLVEIIFADDSITMDDVQDLSFIMEFANMLKVVRQLSSNKKLDYIGKLFKNSFTNKNGDSDEFEEFLFRLESLSYREIKILHYLWSCGDKVPRIYGNNKVDQVAAWDYFKANCVNDLNEFNLEYDIIMSILSGTVRSGFCDFFSRNTPGQTQKVYFVTKYFEKCIMKII